jgi:3-oxoacyl-[acyl-carrier protein] reductase
MSESAKDLVIVTGTSGGLGAAIAAHAVGAGQQVVGIARRAVTASDLGVGDDDYNHVQFDLGDIDAIGEVIGNIVERFGKPYALVNNAAIGTDGLLPTMHNSDIEELIRVNVTSPIVVTKYAVRHMLSARRGRVINVSSIVAQTGYRGLASYGASKSAMEGFTRSLARDLGPRRITVNTVAPGFLATEMTSGLGDKNLDRIRSRSALGRFAEVTEVAAAVAYLLSEAAAGVTGTTMTVDGGSTA